MPRFPISLLVVASPILLASFLACSASTVTNAGSSSGSTSPPPPATSANGLVTIPLIACDPKVYAAEVTIGGAQAFPLLVDTGSSSMAVAATGCDTCTSAGLTTLYQPGATAIDQSLVGNALFGDTQDLSGFKGEIYEDEVGFGPGALSDLARVKLVAISEQAQFIGGVCGQGPPAGVIGFASQPDALDGTNVFMDQAVAAGTTANIFATRLCDTEGTLWLGGYDTTFATGDPQYTPTLSDASPTVGLETVAVAGANVTIPVGAYTQALLDTGSDISSFSNTTFGTITAAIIANPAFSGVFGSSAASFFNSDACVAASQTKAELDATLPPFTMTFGTNPAITVQAAPTESYLLTHNDGKWCRAIIPVDPDSNYPTLAAHIGAPILSSSIVIFDRANKRIGFAPHKACP